MVQSSLVEARRAPQSQVNMAPTSTIELGTPWTETLRTSALDVWIRADTKVKSKRIPYECELGQWQFAAWIVHLQ